MASEGMNGLDLSMCPARYQLQYPCTIHRQQNYGCNKHNHAINEQQRIAINVNAQFGQVKKYSSGHEPCGQQCAPGHCSVDQQQYGSYQLHNARAYPAPWLHSQVCKDLHGLRVRCKLEVKRLQHDNGCYQSQ
jgi:hypothetical protein